MITKSVKEEIDCIDLQNKVQDSVWTKEWKVFGFTIVRSTYNLKMTIRKPEQNHVTGFRRHES